METLISQHACLSADSSSEMKIDLKKNSKPFMEKRRRAKINTCLDELKSLILSALKKDPARHSKLEKADILEMTVRHLQHVQRQRLAQAVTANPAVLVDFRNGFSECAHEVERYIRRIEGVDCGVEQRLLCHVDRCVTNLEQMSPLTFAAVTSPAPMSLWPLQCLPQAGPCSSTTTTQEQHQPRRLLTPLPDSLSSLPTSTDAELVRRNIDEQLDRVSDRSSSAFHRVVRNNSNSETATNGISLNKLENMPVLLKPTPMNPTLSSKRPNSTTDTSPPAKRSHVHSTFNGVWMLNPTMMSSCDSPVTDQSFDADTSTAAASSDLMSSSGDFESDLNKSTSESCDTVKRISTCGRNHVTRDSMWRPW